MKILSRFLLVLALFTVSWLALVSTPAFAIHRGNPAAVGGDPRTYQEPTCLSGGCQDNGQTYVSPASVAAGITTPLGPHQSFASAYKDPVTQAPACAPYSATGSHLGTPALIPSGANCVIQGFHMVDHSGNCVMVDDQGSATGTVQVRDNLIEAEGVCVTGSFGVVIFAMIHSFQNNALCWDIEDNKIDGHAVTLGTTVPSGGMSVIDISPNCLTTIFQGNAVLAWPGRPIQWHPRSTSATLLMKDLFFKGFVYLQPQGHGEIALTLPKTPGDDCACVTYDNVTVVQPQGYCACGNGSIFMTTNTGANFSNAVVKNSTFIINGNGGGATPISNFNSVATLDNGTHTGAGNVLTITSAVHTLFLGQRFTLGATTVTLLSHVSGGTGAGSVWTVADDNSYTPSYNVSGTFSVNSTSVSWAEVEMQTDNYPQGLVSTNNHIDAIGSFGNSAVQSSASCGVPSTFSDVNMISGAAITGWSQGPGSTGC
jgi:hypothetical protein